MADGGGLRVLRPDVVVQAQGSLALGRLWWPSDRLIEGAVALDFRPVPAVMLRVEGRVDHSVTAIFLRHDGTLEQQRPTLSLGMAWSL